MKKIAAFILSVFVMLTVTACDGNAAVPVSSDQGTSVPDTVSAREPASLSLIPEEVEQKDEPETVSAMQYEIGDVIFSDGSVIKNKNITEIVSDNIPLAVIAGFREDGTVFGLGVHRSDTALQWAADNTTGYDLGFAETVCTQNGSADFSGDTDGSDNWAAMGAMDEPGTAYGEQNYPAFYFANTYAAAHEVPPDYALGWYMPSIAELCTIYQNRNVVNASLEKLHQLDSNAAMDGLGTNWYWSSSQAASQDDYAWFVHYFNGYAGECPKNFTNVHALAIRVF